MLKRRHWIEFHEQTWCPGSLRDAVTDTIAFFTTVARPYDAIRARLFAAIDESQARQIVDLCSGAGGPWATFRAELEERNLRVRLTDLHPNANALSVSASNYIQGHLEPVDVTSIPETLEGFRTLFSALHHLRPPAVRELMRSSAAAGAGLAAFEAQDRRLTTMLFFLSYPLLALLAAPFVKPFRWSRLLWTYLIPAMPLVITIDAIVSCLRTYTPDELREIAASAGVTVEAGTERVAGLPLRVTFVALPAVTSLPCPPRGG